MNNATDNATTTPSETPDALDQLLEAIAAVSGMGEVYLYRLNGSQRINLAQFPADTFDPFNIGMTYGTGKYFAQLKQRGRILKSATFGAEGPAAQQEQPAAPQIRPSGQPLDATALLVQMMQQQSQLLTTLLTREPKTDTTQAEILKALLPAALKQPETPDLVYRRVFDMVERAMGREAPEPAEDGTLAQLVKILPTFFAQAKQQSQQQQPAAPSQTTATEATPSPSVTPTPAAPAPAEPANTHAQIIARLEEESGLPLSIIPRVLRMAFDVRLSAEWSADTIAEAINARGEEIAERAWSAIERGEVKQMISGLLHLFPEFEPERAYIEAVWSALQAIARNDQDDAQTDAPGQMFIPGTEPAPQPAPTPEPAPAAPQVFIGNELKNRPATPEEVGELKPKRERKKKEESK